MLEEAGVANAYHRKQLLEYSKQLGADIRKRQRMPDDDASLRTHSAAPASGPDMDDVLGQAGGDDARRQFMILGGDFNLR